MRHGMVEYADGSRVWYRNDKLHRTDGPAVESAYGDREWWVNGKLHRTDGHAIEWGDRTREWWLHGKRYTFRKWLEKNTELTAQQKTVLILKYGDQ